MDVDRNYFSSFVFVGGDVLPLFDSIIVYDSLIPGGLDACLCFPL